MLFTTIGFERLPERFTSALDRTAKFSHTPYDLRTLLRVCEQLARDAVVRAGGRIEKDADGEEVLVIPVEEPHTSKLEQSWEPGPIAGSRYRAEEMERIEAATP